MKSLIYQLLGFFTLAFQGMWAAADFGNQDTFTVQVGFDASAAASKYRAVLLSAAGNPPVCNIASNNLSSAATELAFGVLQTTANSGQAGTVARAGLSKMICGAAVTANALVTHDGSGAAIDAVSGSTVLGRAMHATGAASEYVSVLLQHPVKWGSVA
jgi:hypothetical protein